MKLAIVGTRNFSNYFIFKKIIENHIHNVKLIISGGAKGADSLAAKFAREKEVQLIEYKPDYKKYGRSAPLQRNTLIVENADKVIAFPSKENKSNGTWDSIYKARKLGKEVIIIKV